MPFGNAPAVRPLQASCAANQAVQDDHGFGAMVVQVSVAITECYFCFFSQSSRDIALSGCRFLPSRLVFSDCNAGPLMDWN